MAGNDFLCCIFFPKCPVCTEGVAISCSHTGCRFMVLGYSCALFTIQTGSPWGMRACNRCIWCPSPSKSSSVSFTVSVPLPPPSGNFALKGSHPGLSSGQPCDSGALLVQTTRGASRGHLRAAGAFDRWLWECAASLVPGLNRDKVQGTKLHSGAVQSSRTFCGDGNVLTCAVRNGS